MRTLISTPNVVRAGISGFSEYIPYDKLPVLAEGQVPPEREMLVLEPTFLDFKTATSESLGRLFTVPLAFNAQVLVASVKYSQANAKTFKGYLIELSKYWFAKGYKGFQSVHVPFEGYGCPMVGSTLFLVMSKTTVVYIPTKTTVFPSAIWPDLVSHSLSGKPLSGVAPGSGTIMGLAKSSSSFLPNVDTWRSWLPCEYRLGQTLVTGNLRPEHLHRLFGVSSHQQLSDFAYCTPAPTLETLLEIRSPSTHG